MYHDDKGAGTKLNRRAREAASTSEPKLKEQENLCRTSGCLHRY